MKTCPVCQREVLSKRWDHLLPRCDLSKKAQQARKEQAAAVPPSHNKASLVVTFPDGRRWLLELSLDGEPSSLPTLTQVDGARRNGSTGPSCNALDAAFRGRFWVGTLDIAVKL